MSSLIRRTEVRGGTASFRRCSKTVDFSKQKFFIEPKPIEGQKTYLHYRNPMRGFRYCKGARGKWIAAYRVTEGMRSNWYRHTGRAIPPGPKMLPPQIPAIVKGTLEGFRAKKEMSITRPEINVSTFETQGRSHHHNYTFHLDWRTIPGRSIERETLMMPHRARIKLETSAAKAQRTDNDPVARETSVLGVDGISSHIRNFSPKELRFPPMHPSQNSEFWSRVTITVDAPRVSREYGELKTPKVRSTTPKIHRFATIKRPHIEAIPSMETIISLPALASTKKRFKTKKIPRAKKLAFRKATLREPQIAFADRTFSPITLQRLELQKIRVNEDPKVGGHIGYYGTAKRRIVQLKVATDAESVPPQ
ncbi:MAG: hypothetical protein ABH983_00060 [Candidatus Micrarchaeota archaeon]